MWISGGFFWVPVMYCWLLGAINKLYESVSVFKWKSFFGNTTWAAGHAEFLLGFGCFHHGDGTVLRVIAEKRAFVPINSLPFCPSHLPKNPLFQSNLWLSVAFCNERLQLQFAIRSASSQAMSMSRAIWLVASCGQHDMSFSCSLIMLLSNLLCAVQKSKWAERCSTCKQTITTIVTQPQLRPPKYGVKMWDVDFCNTIAVRTMVAADAEKLSKELVERAAAGRHQDVDRLLKDGADPWLQQITSGNLAAKGLRFGWFSVNLVWSEASCPWFCELVTT